MGLTLVTAPADEPVSLAELQLHLRADHGSEDALITALGRAAREHLETLTRRQFCTATWKLTLDRFPSSAWPWPWREGWWDFPEAAGAVRLPKPPTQSVTSVTYVDGAGVTQTLAASGYQVDLTREPALLAPAYGATWPDTRGAYGAAAVTFVAGYGAPAAVPDGLKQAILLLAGHWYLHREAVGMGGWMELPVGVKALAHSFWHGEYL